MRAELAANAGNPKEFPRDGLPEVAVLGRSNSGKSNLINALLGRRRLARTSARPGRTRRIHFYRVADAFYLVDLPGYGYAAVPREERRSWREMAESYLRAKRTPLRGALLLADVRRGLEEEEVRLLEWLEAEGIPPAIVLTKGDKLSRSQGSSRLRAVREEADLADDRITVVSARTGQGLGTLIEWIRAWTGVDFSPPSSRGGRSPGGARG